MSDNAPDVAGVVEGYRVMIINRDRLSAVNMPYYWEAGPNEALCFGDETHRRTVRKNGPNGLEIIEFDQHGPIPSPLCGCGFWFYRDPYETWEKYGPRPDLSIFSVSTGPDGPRVLTRIQGWGRVIEGTNGWRSQYAKVVGVLTNAPEKYDLIIRHYDLVVEPALQKPEPKPETKALANKLIANYAVMWDDTNTSVTSNPPSPPTSRKSWWRWSNG